ncbi:MAG: NUDIX domain-containing protein, partial [Bacteroidota bacterium]
HLWLVGQYRFPLEAYSWEIPEGGGPLGTDPLTNAQRELKEETGLEQVRLLDKMGETYHTFRRRGKWNLKTTHWYWMHASSEGPLVPQAEENIEDARWMSRPNWLAVAKDSYPLVRQVMEKAFVHPQKP